MGLTSAAITSKGTIAHKERWALDLLTMDKFGAWAIIEQSEPLRKMGMHPPPPACSSSTTSASDVIA